MSRQSHPTRGECSATDETSPGNFIQPTRHAFKSTCMMIQG